MGWAVARDSGGLGKLKMKIGICIVPFGTMYRECREAALAVEGSGFESVWTWDHLLSFNDDDEPVLECWTLLAGLAEATQRVKLGSFVANVLNRAPDVLAKTVATVQQVSGGRIELGIGAGARLKEQVGFNRPFPAGRERVERVGEAVELMRLMWTGERVTYHGKYYSAEGILSTPAPEPVPPIMVAGLGPMSARNAVRVGDGWNCEAPRGWNGEENPKFRQLKPIVLEELARLGRPRDQFEISISDRLDDQVKADPRGYVARMEEEGVDRVVLDIYPPFDLEGLGRVGSALFG